MEEQTAGAETYVIILLIIICISMIAPYIHLFRNKKLKIVQKLVWTLVVFWIAPIGAVLYFIFGTKPKRVKRKKGGEELDFSKVGKPPIFPFGGPVD